VNISVIIEECDMKLIPIREADLNVVHV